MENSGLASHEKCSAAITDQRGVPVEHFNRFAGLSGVAFSWTSLYGVSWPHFAGEVGSAQGAERSSSVPRAGDSVVGGAVHAARAIYIRPSLPITLTFVMQTNCADA